MTRKEDPSRAPGRLALGRRLKVLRAGTKLTQQQVADALEVTRATVGAWELGVSELAALDVVRLADLFKVDVAVILGRAPMPEIKVEET